MKIFRTPFLRMVPTILAAIAMCVADVMLVSGTATSGESELFFDAGNNRWVRRPAGELRKKAVSARADSSPIPREVVSIGEDLRPGTVLISTGERRLYHVLTDGRAMRYAIGVGREGFEWSGTERIRRKAEWPSWTPPVEMVKREAANGRSLPPRTEGGRDNPLGARAIYLGDTYYRIHGTNQPWTIGHAVSSGCIRMANEDVIHLYESVRIGDTVIVRQ